MSKLKYYARAAFAAVLALSMAGCAVMYKSGFETRYEQHNVYVGQAERLADNRLQISYRPMNETVWYSPGVNYAVRDDALYITPVRCYSRRDCAPQAVSASGLKDDLSVTVPYQ